MSRYIPLALVQHLRGSETTTCLLMRIDPVAPGYASYGVTNSDRNIVYDDGSGPMLYSAAVGYQPSTVMGSANLSVDNAEAQGLLPEFDVPISEVDIRAGVYDFARFRMYLVNYEDLTPGDHVEIHAGTLGRISIDDSGLSTVTEQRGLTAQLKQSVCGKDSLSCRAIFGSQPNGSSTPGPQVQRDWCGFDATTLEVTGTVTDVGLETNLVFRVGGFTHAEDELMFGSLTFDSGMNAGRVYEIETNTAGGEITLGFPAMFPVTVGTVVTYRPGCNLQARDEDRGCKRWFAADWVLHFRGEPDIPIGDAGQMETPGASAGPGTGAPMNETYTETP